MKNKIYLLILLFITMSTCLADESVHVENPADTNSYYVPETISQEAASFIKLFKKSWRNRKWPEADDIEAWYERKAEYEKATIPNSKKLIESFKPEIEKRTIAGVNVLDIKPKSWKSSNHLVIYLHGGAYTLFSAQSSLNNILPLADLSNLRFIAVDYTTAPVSRWQRTTDDVLDVIKKIYEENGSENIALMGDSAGGGLAAGMIHKLADNNLPMPSALLLWSPWADLTNSGDTYYTLRDAELHYTYPSMLLHSANAYADFEDQKHPYVSPVYGDFTSDFPPTLIQGGTKELFISNFVRLYQKIDTVSNHGAKLDLYEGMWHVFQGNHEIPESQVAIKKSALFLKKHLK